ncbi:hypothetical protein ACJIZ3_013343 [Penstemon smallii]|uniref:X8 domain-containing protein n=1 Tax=Penstemon smallii TaxID=265156 RepID=A0ABD3URP0_9LAMI
MRKTIAKPVSSGSPRYGPYRVKYLGGILRPIKGQATGQGAWCIARPSTPDEALLDNINFACEVKLGRHYWNCDFKKSAVIVVTDPSNQLDLSLSLYVLTKQFHTHTKTQDLIIGSIPINELFVLDCHQGYGDCKFAYAY